MFSEFVSLSLKTWLMRLLNMLSETANVPVKLHGISFEE